MDTLWIGNGQLVLPQRVLENGSILIENGRIVEIGYPCPQNVQRVDAEGGYILPGFIDLHVHGGGGADVMDATVQALKTMARTHAAHGTTALVPTTMTCEDALLERVIDRFLEARSAAAEGAQLLGLHLEGPFFAASSRGAQPVLCQRVPDRAMLERILRRAQGHILRWDAAPELEQMELFAQVMKANGVMAAVAHTSATAEQAMRAFDWGFSHVTHFYNAMTTFHKANSWCIQLDQIFMVSNESKHPEAVMEFMAYLLDPETAGYWAATTLNPSVVPGVETEMPDVIMTAIKAKESGNIAHEGSLTTWLKGEYLTAWRQLTQTFAADRTITADAIIEELQAVFDEINATK